MRVMYGLQVLRAVGAFLVLIQHAAYFASLTTKTEILEFQKLHIGGLGVYLFFCLSGAVMSIASNTSAKAFILNRATRIYPPYFAALAISTAVFYPVTSGRTPSMEFSWSLLLIPTGQLDSSFQVPYWTLVYELFFYATIFVLLVLRFTPNARCWFMVVWSIAIVAIHQFFPLLNLQSPNAIEIAFSPLNLYFTGGYVLMHSVTSKDGMPAAVMLLAIAAACTLYLTDLRYTLACGLLECAAVYLFASLKRVPKPIVRIGDYSYGLYLVHLIPIYLLFIYSIGIELPYWQVLAMNIFVGASSGLVFGYIEHLIHKKIFKPLLAGKEAKIAIGLVAGTSAR